MSQINLYFEVISKYCTSVAYRPSDAYAWASLARQLTCAATQSPNDNRSDQMNPNNPAYTGSRGGSDGHDDNHANQLNPNNPGSSSGQSSGHDDNHANQLNPNNPGYGKSKGEAAEHNDQA